MAIARAFGARGSYFPVQVVWGGYSTLQGCLQCVRDLVPTCGTWLEHPSWPKATSLTLCLCMGQKSATKQERLAKHYMHFIGLFHAQQEGLVESWIQELVLQQLLRDTSVSSAAF